MTTWNGWETYLLSDGPFPDTAANRAFLDDWAQHAEVPNCSNNPIDLTQPIRGESSACKQTGSTGRAYQRYSSHSYARTAWGVQIKSGDYPHLRAALKSGNPYTVSDGADVVSDLSRWQSFTFATYYLKVTGVGGPGTVKAAHAHGGWKDLQRSFNRHMPASLRDSRRAMNAGKHALARAGKVRL